MKRFKVIAASTGGASQANKVKSLMKQLFDAIDELYSVDEGMFEDMDLNGLYNELDVTIRENA